MAGASDKEKQGAEAAASYKLKITQKENTDRLFQYVRQYTEERIIQKKTVRLYLVYWHISYGECRRGGMARQKRNWRAYFGQGRTNLWQSVEYFVSESGKK
ncbi:hypothetical protein [Eubacterium sp. An11]|uniref:hypothetical protein n=1 Tax=Eubacterium sp. An11 TaxID=1965542 RepID=UPI001FA83F4D|nr:hypothetical protein [Eubacterium sp. An11]